MHVGEDRRGCLDTSIYATLLPLNLSAPYPPCIHRRKVSLSWGGGGGSVAPCNTITRGGGGGGGGGGPSHWPNTIMGYKYAGGGGGGGSRTIRLPSSLHMYTTLQVHVYGFHPHDPPSLQLVSMVCTGPCHPLIMYMFRYLLSNRPLSWAGAHTCTRLRVYSVYVVND